MANRPSRSSSIPIPRSASSTSPSRNIESVISIPFTGPTRTRLPSQGSIRSSVEHDHRAVGTGHPHHIAGGSMNPSTSPIRPTARSFTQPSPISARAPSRPANFFPEPRIVRAESSRMTESPFIPSTSPTSARKPNVVGVRAPSYRVSPAPPLVIPAPPTSFERPAYLDHSALRHLLQTDTPSLLPPARKIESRPVNPRAYSGTTTDSDEDSNGSPPPQANPSSSSNPVISPDQVLKLPTRWSVQFRHHILNLSDDGRELVYPGSGNSDREREAAAAARTIQPIPPACGIYYYEVDIRSKDQKARISVGFAGSDVRTSRLPGWEPNSWGYHGDDGCSFAAEKNGTKYGPTFGAGDTIGCGIDFTSHRAFYTKNGVMLGPVFENVGKGIDLYPSVGLQHVGESVKVNFGHEPFKFDIEFYVQEQRNRTWAEIVEKPIDTSYLPSDSNPSIPTPTPEEQSKKTLNQLVLSYLAHHGYVKSARAFQKQIEGSTASAPINADSEDVEMKDEPITGFGMEAEIELRTKIVNSVVKKDIDFVLDETQKVYPSVLEAEEGLMLVKLRCRKFIELLLDAVELKKSLVAASGVDIEEEEDEGVDGMDDEMEVDEDPAAGASTNGFGPSSRIPLKEARWKAALTEAILYGQSLQDEYGKDAREEVRDIFKQTFSIVAYEDPLAAGGSVAEIVGNQARMQLANELNQAILKSQGKPTHPPLEMVYRYASAYILQLGLSGVGRAAFTDLQKELLDS